jgi:hypothetical protein
MSSIFYVFGNPLVEEDSLPLRLIEKLRREFPSLEFREFDTTEDLTGRDLNIIDTVKGIKKVMVIGDIDKISISKVYSMHDFDLGQNLKLMKKTGMIDRVSIYGIPMGMKESEALSGVIRLISKNFNKEKS